MKSKIKPRRYIGPQMTYRPNGELYLCVPVHRTSPDGKHPSWCLDIPFSEFSQTLTCIEDFERLVINAIDRKTG